MQRNKLRMIMMIWSSNMNKSALIFTHGYDDIEWTQYLGRLSLLCQEPQFSVLHNRKAHNNNAVKPTGVHLFRMSFNYQLTIFNMDQTRLLYVQFLSFLNANTNIAQIWQQVNKA